MSGDIDMRPIHEWTTMELAQHIRGRHPAVAIAWVDEPNDCNGIILHGNVAARTGLATMLNIQAHGMLEDALFLDDEEDDDGD